MNHLYIFMNNIILLTSGTVDRLSLIIPQGGDKIKVHFFFQIFSTLKIFFDFDIFVRSYLNIERTPHKSLIKVKYCRIRGRDIFKRTKSYPIKKKKKHDFATEQRVNTSQCYTIIIVIILISWLSIKIIAHISHMCIDK